MHTQRIKVSVTTAADGSYTGYTEPVTGLISAIHYLKTDFADTVDFAITCELTGHGLWTEANVTASAVRAPRQVVHDLVGGQRLFAGAGQPLADKIAVKDERIKFAITNGGDTKTGTFYLILE